MSVKKLNRILSVISVTAVILISCLFPVSVRADAGITISTDSTTADVNGAIVVSVEISSDGQIGTYYIELEYDSSRMRYDGGAEAEQDGILTLTGTGMSRTVKYEINFTGSNGGEAGVIVRNARVNDTEGNAVFTTDSGLLKIVVSGQTDNTASFEQKLAEEQELLQSDLPIAGSIHDSSGNTFYVVDLTRTTPDSMTFAFDTVEDTFEGQTITFATDKDGMLRILPLMDMSENVSLYALNGNSFYPLTEHTDAKGNKYVYVTLNACSSMPQKIASTAEMWDYVVYAIGKDGSGGFYLIDETGNLSLYTVLNSSSITTSGLFGRIFSGERINWERILLIATIIILGVIALSIVLKVVVFSERRRKIKMSVEAELENDTDEPVEIDEDIRDIDIVRRATDVEAEIDSEPVSEEMKNRSDQDSADSVSRKKVLKVAGYDGKIEPEMTVADPDQMEKTLRFDKNDLVL